MRPISRISKLKGILPLPRGHPLPILRILELGLLAIAGQLEIQENQGQLALRLKIVLPRIVPLVHPQLLLREFLRKQPVVSHEVFLPQLYPTLVPFDLQIPLHVYHLRLFTFKFQRIVINFTQNVPKAATVVQHASLIKKLELVTFKMSLYVTFNPFIVELFLYLFKILPLDDHQTHIVSLLIDDTLSARRLVEVASSIGHQSHVRFLTLVPKRRRTSQQPLGLFVHLLRNIPMLHLLLNQLPHGSRGKTNVHPVRLEFITMVSSFLRTRLQLVKIYRSWISRANLYPCHENSVFIWMLYIASILLQFILKTSITFPFRISNFIINNGHKRNRYLPSKLYPRINKLQIALNTLLKLLLILLTHLFPVRNHTPILSLTTKEENPAIRIQHPANPISQLRLHLSKSVDGGVSTYRTPEGRLVMNVDFIEVEFATGQTSVIGQSLIFRIEEKSPQNLGFFWQGFVQGLGV